MRAPIPYVRPEIKPKGTHVAVMAAKQDRLLTSIRSSP